MSEFLIFDVETTGIDTEKDRIVQLVAALADSDGNVKVYEEWLIDPGVPVPEEASAVHGFTTKYLEENGSHPYKALSEARGFFGAHRTATWVAFNLNYDASILSTEMYRHHVDYGFRKAFTSGQISLFDPLVVDRAKDKYRKGSRKLKDMAAHYGIVVDEGKLHNARYDVEITAKVASAVVKKYGLPSNTEQARWQEEWRAGFEKYLRKTDPTASVERGWPLREKEENS